MLNVENLQLIMKAKGVNSLKELSIQSGVPYSTLNYMLTGHDMFIGTLANIAQSLKEPLDSLVNIPQRYIIYYQKEGTTVYRKIDANNIFEVTARYMM